MDDCLVIGAGVIGLSLAYEAARAGLRVRVIDSGQPGREASWAGAGILPPAGLPVNHPLEKLRAQSNRLHAEWAETLRAETGIDNGYRRSGGLYLEREPQAAAALVRAAAEWRRAGIRVEDLSAAAIRDLEPMLCPREPVAAACMLPDEAQIRNPRHLKALLIACAKRGVEVTGGIAAEDFDLRGGRVEAVRTSTGRLPAGAFCVTAGSWSGSILGRLGCRPAIKPIRGQMALLSATRPLLTRIINEGPRYLVPRPDGRVLAGSTQEDVGFDRSTTPGGIEGLLRFAISLVPALADAQFERCWAGLRPGTLDGLPYLGRVPGAENAFVAAGHFRSGLQLSPGTAVAMAKLVRGEQPAIDLAPFRVDRG